MRPGPLLVFKNEITQSKSFSMFRSSAANVLFQRKRVEPDLKRGWSSKREEVATPSAAPRAAPERANGGATGQGEALRLGCLLQRSNGGNSCVSPCLLCRGPLRVKTIVRCQLKGRIIPGRGGEEKEREAELSGLPSGRHRNHTNRNTNRDTNCCKIHTNHTNRKGKTFGSEFFI